jgi:hypothetical protein
MTEVVAVVEVRDVVEGVPVALHCDAHHMMIQYSEILDSAEYPSNATDHVVVKSVVLDSSLDDFADLFADLFAVERPLQVVSNDCNS